jgi:uncharacterized protein (DUF1778 family)
MLDAARRAAEDALLERTVFTVSPKAYAEFLVGFEPAPIKPMTITLTDIRRSLA